MNKVIQSFRCKETGQAYYAGQSYDGDRTEELVELGYIGTDAEVKPEEGGVAQPEPEVVEEHPRTKDLTVKEIKVKLDELGIEYDSNAKKAELLELLGD